MPLQLSVIEYEDATNRSVVARIPADGSVEIKHGAELIVHQNQEAVFFRDGEARDVFGPGRHTLTAASVPLLNRILTLPWGRKPVRALVYFVGRQTFVDQKWGTLQPIVFEDGGFGIVRLRSYGRFSFRVADSTVLINRLVGTKGLYSTEDVTAFMRDLIVSGMTDLLGTLKMDLVQLPAKFEELAAAIRAKLADDFAKFGLELVDFVINSITPPEKVQQAIDEGAGERAATSIREPAASTEPEEPSGDPRAMLDGIARAAGWAIETTPNGLEVVVGIGPLRRQKVQVQLDRKDSDGHALVSFSSVCGPAMEETATRLLRYNSKMAHAAFAIQAGPAGDNVVVVANQLQSTADQLELQKALVAVALQADQAEQQLTGGDSH